jgi:hypothetical protein
MFCITGKDEKDGERHEEDLVECHHPQDVPGLELHEADQEPGAPPRVLTCPIKTEINFNVTTEAVKACDNVSLCSII